MKKMMPIDLDESDLDESDLEIELLLGNRMIRCSKFGDSYRPLMACHKHSQGRYNIPLVAPGLEECIGCTKWLSEIERQGRIREVKDHWPKIVI